MARHLIWSPEAVEDIESIARYIERDSPWYAKAVVTSIVTTAESVPDYPEMGKMAPEIGDASIRERLVYSYRLIYRVDSLRILMVAVIHGSRLRQPLIARIEST
jgi:plasmid stabilization system protein ParE